MPLPSTRKSKLLTAGCPGRAPLLLVCPVAAAAAMCLLARAIPELAEQLVWRAERVLEAGHGLRAADWAGLLGSAAGGGRVSCVVLRLAIVQVWVRGNSDASMAQRATSTTGHFLLNTQLAFPLLHPLCISASRSTADKDEECIAALNGGLAI